MPDGGVGVTVGIMDSRVCVPVARLGVAMGVVVVVGVVLVTVTMGISRARAIKRINL